METYFIATEHSLNNPLLVVKEIKLTKKEYYKAFDKPYRTFKDAFNHAKRFNLEKIELWEKSSSSKRWIQLMAIEANSITKGVATV